MATVRVNAATQSEEAEHCEAPKQNDVFRVDAFASEVFRGNPACVVVLQSWPADTRLQQIAEELNAPVTAFIVASGQQGKYALRWFLANKREVPLCGHAALAAGFVVLRHLHAGLREVTFTYGADASPLVVEEQEGKWFAVVLPALESREIPAPEGLADALGATPSHTRVTDAGKVIAVFERAADVEGLTPDFPKLAAAAQPGCWVTAAGAADSKHDIVSRAFFPAHGVNEDAVCGSMHAALVPYWTHRLGQFDLLAWQASDRGGELNITHTRDNVVLRGQAVLFASGTLRV